MQKDLLFVGGLFGILIQVFFISNLLGVCLTVDYISRSMVTRS